MSATRLDTWPYFTITKSGVQYAIPAQATVQRDGTYRPVPVARNPKIAFPPPLATANPDGSAARRNYDIDEVIFTSWQGGMGEDTYAAASIPTSFQTSRCDTRRPGTLTCRPLATQVGGTISGFANVGARVVELDTNRLLLYAQLNNYGYYFNGASWSRWQAAAVDLTNPWDHVQSQNGIFVLTVYSGAFGQVLGTPGVYRSTDGSSWTLMAQPAGNAQLLAEFDERIWTVASENIGAAVTSHTTYSSVDLYSAAGGGGTWVAGNVIVTARGEIMTRLFTWVYPPDKGRDTLWLQTNCRLLYYDYYAATPSWKTWFRMHPPRGSVTLPGRTYAHAWQKNNNLYASFDQDGEWLREFTGNTITPLKPNKRGAMPAGTRLQPCGMAGTDGFLYLWGTTPDGDAASLGALVALAEGGAFHHIYDSTTKTVIGGGLGQSKLYTVVTTGGNAEVWSQDNTDEETLPQHATAGSRTYDSLALVHKSAWIHGGLANVNKRVLYVEVDCLKADGTVGLDTGATVKVEIVTRAATTSLGTLTDASTFPAVLAFSGGLACKEFQVWVTLTRGTATSATPIVRAIKLGYRPRPKQRYTYTLRADVRDDCPAFQTANGLFRGHSASYLRQFLDEVSDNDDSGQDDPLVGLSYGGEGNSLHPRFRSAPQCEILVQGQESVDKADGLFLLTFNDVSAPTSG